MAKSDPNRRFFANETDPIESVQQGDYVVRDGHLYEVLIIQDVPDARAVALRALAATRERPKNPNG